MSKPGDMHEIKLHWEKEARNYEGFVIKLVPFYEEILNALVSTIPFRQGDAIKVLDLGSGTGEVTRRVKVQFPHAIITCIDIAAGMNEIAMARLKNKDIDFITDDFCKCDFPGEYDVILSCLAMHHVFSNFDKKQLFHKIFRSLKLGGVFTNADVVLGANDTLQNMYIRRWVEFMRRNYSQEEIEKEWLRRFYEKDHPFKLMQELEWMRQAGFTDVDVVMKYYHVGVYTGQKETNSEG